MRRNPVRHSSCHGYLYNNPGPPRIPGKGVTLGDEPKITDEKKWTHTNGRCYNPCRTCQGSHFHDQFPKLAKGPDKTSEATVKNITNKTFRHQRKVRDYMVQYLDDNKQVVSSEFFADDHEDQAVYSEEECDLVDLYNVSQPVTLDVNKMSDTEDAEDLSCKLFTQDEDDKLGFFPPKKHQTDAPVPTVEAQLIPDASVDTVVRTVQNRPPVPKKPFHLRTGKQRVQLRPSPTSHVKTRPPRPDKSIQLTMGFAALFHAGPDFVRCAHYSKKFPS